MSGPSPSQIPLLAVLLVAVAVIGFGSGAGAQSEEGEGGEAELAARYAPVVMVKTQDHDCDDEGEPYGPAAVETVLGNPEVLLRQVGEGDPVVMRGPTAAEIFELGEGFYLDFPGSSLEPGCIYEQDWDRYSAGRPPVVYARTATQDDRPGFLVLQYWTYWYYNDWNNKHESDWEGIQLLFAADSVEEALQTEPVSVGYAQHEGGERAGWSSDHLTRDGLHPVVYTSAGSHASYYGSALYLGRRGSEGFGCDDTDGPSTRLDPEVVVLHEVGDDPADDQAWITFRGRWGERHGGADNGPTGPATKDRWDRPVDWHDSLRTSSVVVPTGDSQAAGLVSSFCGVVGWGSNQLLAFKTSPLRVVVVVVVLVLLARWLVRRTEWTEVPDRPLRRRRRAGQALSGAARAYREEPRIVAGQALVYLPAALGAAILVEVVRRLPIVADVAGASHGVGAVGLVLALVAGGVAHSLAVYVVEAVGATQRSGTVAEVGTREAVAAVWARRRDLAVAYGRAFGVVVGLAVTLVGLPWAIRQFGRYLFLAQVVMVEGATGAAAPGTSSRLVRGRWWRTVVAVAVANLAVAALALLTGLLLLVIGHGLPLWAFAAIIPLLTAALVPFAATTQTLLYGDAAAEDRAEVLEPAPA